MNTIRRTLLTRLLTGLALVLTAAGAAVFYRTRSVLTHEFDAALRAQASVIISLTEYDHGQVQMDASRERLPDYYQLWLPEGRMLGRTDLPRQAGNVTLPDGRPGRAAMVEFSPKPGDDQPVTTKSPLVTLVVAQRRTTLDRTLAGIAGGLLLVGILVLAATAFVVTVAVRTSLAPLAELGTAIATSSLETRFTATGELQPVAERLNDLLARLDAAFQRERRVTADIAHELRTPIAELRALAEVGVKWPGEAAFQDALEIAQRMELTVTGLLALARHEAGKQPVASEPVSLATLVADVWQAFAARADDRHLTVTFAVTGEWRTDATLLRLIIGNLLTNAIEYASAGGTVHVAGTARQLEVENATEQLGPEDLPHLFERFWRKDAARTAGHSGLGLPLARAAATALGLELTAALPAPTMLRVTLSQSR